MRKYSIDILKFILIFWIVLFHYTSSSSINGIIQFPLSFKNGGSVGTTLFFILAGYFMGSSLLAGQFDKVMCFIQYCIKRYWRFWPAYAISVIIIYFWMLAMPVPDKLVGVEKFLINLVFIIHPGRYVDGAHWFLATLLEVQFFTTLLKFVPFNFSLLRINVHFREVLLVLLFLIFALWASQLTYEPTFKYIFVNSEAKLLLGVIICMAYKYKSSFSWMLLILSSVLIGYVMWQFWYVFIPVYIFMLVLLFVDIPTLSNFSPVAQYLGGISFTWYLVHQNIGYSILYHFCPHGNISFAWVLVPVFVTIIIAIFIDFMALHLSTYITKSINILKK